MQIDIREFDPISWRNIIDVVPQVHPILFASNIMFGDGEHAAPRLANCEFVWGMPKGFDTESDSERVFVSICAIERTLTLVQLFCTA